MLDEKLQNPNRKMLREFGLVMAGAFGGIFGVFLPWLFSAEWPVWPWPVAGLFLISGLVAPLILRPAFKAWMKFGHLLSHIMTPFILGILFYIIITPVGLIRRVFGHDSMRRDSSEKVDSFRQDSVQPDSNRMERPF